MTTTYKQIYEFCNTIANMNNGPTVTSNLDDACLNLCMMAYYAGKNGDMTNTWQPNRNQWQEEDDNSYANAIAAGWAYYSQGHKARTYERSLLPAQPHVPDMKLSDPDKYDGNRSKYDTFVMQLSLKFISRPDIFHTSQAKLAYAGSFLTDDAARWFKPNVKANENIDFASYQEFLDGLRAGFADSDEKATAERKLRELRQDGSTSAYYSKFDSYASPLDWNDAAKLSGFKAGLNDEIKDALSNHLEQPKTYVEFASYAIQLGNQLYDRRQQKRKESSHDKKKKDKKKTDENPPSTVTTVTSTASGTHPGPMDLSAGKISQEEKNRRIKEDLCNYCGDDGHYAATCPKKSRRARQQGRAAHAAISAPSR